MTSDPSELLRTDHETDHETDPALDDDSMIGLARDLAVILELRFTPTTSPFGQPLAMTTMNVRELWQAGLRKRHIDQVTQWADWSESDPDGDDLNETEAEAFDGSDRADGEACAGDDGNMRGGIGTVVASPCNEVLALLEMTARGAAPDDLGMIAWDWPLCHVRLVLQEDTAMAAMRRWDVAFPDVVACFAALAQTPIRPRLRGDLGNSVWDTAAAAIAAAYHRIEPAAIPGLWDAGLLSRLYGDPSPEMAEDGLRPWIPTPGPPAACWWMDLPAWIDAGYGPDETARLRSLPPNHPDRPSPHELLLAARMQQDGNG